MALTDAFQVAMFDNVFDNEPKGGIYSWDKIINGFSRVVETNDKDTRNKDVRLFCPAVFKSGGRRSKADVECVTMLVFDMDGGYDPTDFIEAWQEKGLEFIFYTSFSHTLDFPKWRVIFPFKTPVRGQDWEKAWRLMNQDLAQGLSDKACKDPCHMYFMPCTKYGMSEYYVKTYYPGNFLDPKPYVEQVETATKTEFRETQSEHPGAPGNWLNENISIEEIIEPHGWEKVENGRLQKWRRPGKGTGTSATWGYRPDYDGERFFCFSSSTDLPENRILTKFGVYTFLNHGGDFKAAASAIAKQYKLPDSRLQDDHSDTFDAVVASETGDDEMPGVWLNTANPSDLLEYGVFGKYVPLREITLFEGAEGEGKTTTLCGIMAHGSVGYSPITDEAFEPFKSIIFTSEQRPGSLMKRIIELKGDVSKIKIVTKDFVLSTQGIERVEAEIIRNGFKLVIFDPIWEYKPDSVNESSRPNIQKWATRIQRMADKCNCAVILVNHFAKFMRGKDVRDLGINNSGLRSRSRSHMCLFTDPDNPRYKTIIHCKANFENSMQEAFAFEWNKANLIEWTPTGFANTDFINEVLKSKK